MMKWQISILMIIRDIALHTDFMESVQPSAEAVLCMLGHAWSEIKTNESVEVELKLHSLCPD